MSGSEANHDDQHQNKPSDETDLVSQLPKSEGKWLAHSNLVLYKDVWVPPIFFRSIVAFESHFECLDNDIFVASLPKSGTTWLKALVFSIAHRDRYSISDTPLLGSNPHELVPFAELSRYGSAESRPGEATSIGSRVWSAHLPYSLWPESIKGSGCRVVYIARNPLDVLTSGWNFFSISSGGDGPAWTAEEYANRFCNGDGLMFGPHWSNVLGFWKASLETPEKIMFLKYEDLKADTASHVKRIARFVGFPFSEEEERLGVVEEIVQLCSFKSLKSMEVNKNGKVFPMYGNNNLFRKGEVGDWVNHLSPATAKRVIDVVEEKLSGSGLTFKQ